MAHLSQIHVRRAGIFCCRRLMLGITEECVPLGVAARVHAVCLSHRYTRAFSTCGGGCFMPLHDLHEHRLV
jgi:hypothetical protein